MINNFQLLLDLYNKNKNKSWNDWLIFNTIFNKSSKQGLVGLLEIQQNKSNKIKSNKIVFKISRYINYLIEHESTIMYGLYNIACYCPNFCKIIGTINCELDPNNKSIENPFDISNTKYTINKKVLLCEYLENSYKFCNYIRATTKISEDILYSTIKQILLAINIAQKEKQFSHYDLHSNNIMMRKCKKDLVLLYVIDKENQFTVPTLGHYATIIDFGFSYINDMKDCPLWPSMGFTDVGFMSDRFDWVADPKLFLITVSCEIKNKRNTNNSKKLNRIVKNIFYPLNIEWDSGWDKGHKSAIDYILDFLNKNKTIHLEINSKLFEDYQYYCIDIIQTIITMPIKKRDYSNIFTAYKAFLSEWIKIEKEISSSYFNLYILQGIVDSARQNQLKYSNSNTRQNAIINFQQSIIQRLDKVSKFCKPKNLKYETLLCSLFVLAQSIEGILYEILDTRMLIKNKEYSKLPLKNIEQIFGAIDVNLPDTYIYNKNTTICIINNITKNMDFWKIPPDEIDNINNIHNLSRGTYLFDLWTLYSNLSK